MNYHYETQPVPNPISYYLHHAPTPIHAMETAGNHFVELIAPLFLLLPRPFTIFGGLIQIAFQVNVDMCNTLFNCVYISTYSAILRYG